MVAHGTVWDGLRVLPSLRARARLAVTDGSGAR